MEYDDHEEDEEEEEEDDDAGYDRRSPPSARKLPTPGRPGGGRYRECLKNHAVGIGGHAVDGCGEFMPAGEEGTLDALKCAACSCHRNFHRRELPAADAGVVGFVREHAAHLGFPYYRAPVGAYGLLQHVSHSRHPPPLALPSTSGDAYDFEVSPGELHSGPGAGWAAAPSGKKRFRTKFTQEQKDRMLEFSERMGWRIQKHDEAAVQLFCEEVGVRRQVLKVWMHNNKNTLGRPPPPPPPPPSLPDPIPDLDSRERLPPP